ncbi:MAG TPA: PQQ-dependent dehydrogenase, methanol/ethanol family [Bryobacteraceae bacterium]|nr:PQQ-dependent dehydrogenase, methanol/ethanol family [Bryobacteraceae bacterium]
MISGAKQLFLIPVLLAAAASGALGQSLIESGRKQFEARCGACHGADGGGGELGPSLLERRGRTLSEQTIRDAIRNGIPEAGMPAFHLSAEDEGALVGFVRALTRPAAESEVPGDAAAGDAFFWGQGKCGGCHMIRGRGGITGPDLTSLGQQRTLGQIQQALERPELVRQTGYRQVTVRLADGNTLSGVAKNESAYDLQLQDRAGRLHFLRRSQISRVEHDPKPLMPAFHLGETQKRDLLAFLSRLNGAGPGTSTWSGRALPQKPGEWATYHGDPGGNRYSSLDQITTGNVQSLGARWIFPVAGARRLEVTPLVVDGVMYVTTANQAYALDARNGRAIWHYQRPLTKGLVGDAAGAINRGVAVLGDRLFMVTDNAHLLALDRRNGGLIWDVEMADYHQHYGATSAPLVVRDLVISGTSGGDEGARGFVAAYKASTGERVWRFSTMPKPGEPLASTWVGRAIEHGCGTAWLTGTYDFQNNTLFWPTGNPCPDYNGDERKGDNLYSDSVLALEPETGKLKWYYQFTPHDLHDWDSTETLMVVDAEFQGRQRQLLMQANRNGFFYVLDRTNGKVLLAKPFVKKLTWASGIGPDGRPQVLPGSEPTVAGAKVCPAVEGASNWMSTAYNPSTGLFYVMALEKCNIYTKSSAWWEPGKSFYGGGTRDIPDEPGMKYLRAINIQTGEIVWELPQPGNAQSWGGVLSTAGGLVFYGDDSGAFAAADAKTGNPLWYFHTNQLWKASPMTYLVDGKQYVAVAAGSSIIAFGL